MAFTVVPVTNKPVVVGDQLRGVFTLQFSAAAHVHGTGGIDLTGAFSQWGINHIDDVVVRHHARAGDAGYYPGAQIYSWNSWSFLPNNQALVCYGHDAAQASAGNSAVVTGTTDFANGFITVEVWGSSVRQ